MKTTNKLFLKCLLSAPLLALSLMAGAQSESDLAAFLKSTKQDANVLITGYTAPVIKSASYGMTNGWYTTGKTHKKLGFDLGFTVSAAFIPNSDNYFNPTGQLSMSTTFQNTTNPGAGAPTFMGPKDHTTYTSTYDNGTVSGQVSYNGPEGLDVKHYAKVAAFPVPMVQLGIGLIKNTDLKIRYLPSVSKGDSKVSMFGVGLMHDVKQYLPGHDLLPFDLSILVAYNSVRGKTSLTNTDANSDRPTSSDGKLDYKLNSWVGQAIISKKVAVFTFYLGAGYGAVSTNTDITGTFTYTVSQQPVSITDPYANKFSNNGAKLTGGMRLKFGPIYLVGDYTLQKYNAATVGIGTSIR